jgi:hypothetical protein
MSNTTSFRHPTWSLAGMTCSFEDPAAVKTAWAFEALKLIREFHVHLADLKAQVKRPALLKLTRKRLENLITRVSEQTARLEGLLAPLDWRSVQETNLLSYLSENPGPSALAANYDNLFRDWIWGDVENKAAVDFIRAVTAEETAEWGATLILGAGGCRLAHDLHLEMKPNRTVACDFNPLLMLTAGRILRGEAVDLVEFPLMPATGELAAIPRTLKLPDPAVAPANFEFVLADATRAAFADESFDIVVTPWLIDVVKTPLPHFLRLLNRILPVGGRWISFGPLGFNDPILAAHYSLEEVKYLIEKSGFEIQAEKYEMIPYMQNPSSNTHRIERVLVFRARKTRTVDSAETEVDPSTPAWELDKDAPLQIPIKEMNLVNGHLFNAELLAAIQNETSFNQVVDQIAAKHGVPPAHAARLIDGVLRNVEALAHRNPLRR